MTGTRFFSTHPLASVAMPTSVNFIPTPTGREQRRHVLPGAPRKRGTTHSREAQFQPRLVPACRNASLVSRSSSRQHPRCASGLRGHNREGGLQGQPAKACAQGLCPLPAGPTPSAGGGGPAPAPEVSPQRHSAVGLGLLPALHWSGSPCPAGSRVGVAWAGQVQQ